MAPDDDDDDDEVGASTQFQQAPSRRDRPRSIAVHGDERPLQRPPEHQLDEERENWARVERIPYHISRRLDFARSARGTCATSGDLLHGRRQLATARRCLSCSTDTDDGKSERQRVNGVEKHRVYTYIYIYIYMGVCVSGGGVGGA